MGASQDKLNSPMAMMNNPNPENWPKTVQEEIQKLSKDPSQRELYRILQMQFDSDGRSGNGPKGESPRAAPSNKDNPIVELLKGKRLSGGLGERESKN